MWIFRQPAAKKQEDCTALPKPCNPSTFYIFHKDVSVESIETTSMLLRSAGRILVVLVAVGAYHIYTKLYPNEPCHLDPPIELQRGDVNLSWDACHVFSLEYEEARQKFRKAARKLKKSSEEGQVLLSSLPIIMDDGTPDSPLTADIVIWKGTLPGVLVISSGTHGVEGYAGSAIQLALLQEGVLPKDRPTIVMIHVVNPSGMKTYRRFNEDNVDLNRNCLLDFETFLENRDPNIVNYDDFRDLTAPTFRPRIGWDDTVGFWQKAIPALWKHGYVNMKRVLVSAQYHHPEGIFYGGNRRATSVDQLVEFIQTNEQTLFPESEQTVWFDIHSGLGKFGMDTINIENDVAEDQLRKWFHNPYSIITPQVEDTQAMSGYDLTVGGLSKMVHDLSNGRALSLIQEFGTLPGVLVARALVLENMMYHYGFPDDRKAYGRPWLQSVFYPQSTKWRASVVQRGVSLALESLEYIKGSSAKTN